MKRSANDPPRLLITGAGGFLGWHLCRKAAPVWKVFGLYRAHPAPLTQIEHVQIDLTDFKSVKTLFKEIRPMAVIHLAAQSKTGFCQQHPKQSRLINVDAAANLAGLFSDRSIPFAFTSTDLVFDGNRPPYAEDSPKSPLSVYGEHKAIAEEKILNLYPKAAVCRMPFMFGYTGGYEKGFSGYLLGALKKRNPVRLFADEIRTPVDGIHGAGGLLMALEKAEGLIHLGGRTPISRFEMGRMIETYLKVETSVIVPISTQAVDTGVPRSPDVSLDSKKAYAMGYDPGDIQRCFEVFVAAASGNFTP